MSRPGQAGAGGGAADLAIGFAAASLAICNAVSDHDFNLREILALEVVRKLSFGAGKTEAYIPDHGFFVRAMRVSKGNVSEILGALKRKQVIEESPEGFYGFRVPISGWRVARRSEEVEVIDQLELLERPPHLQSELRKGFVAQCSYIRGQVVPSSIPDLTPPQVTFRSTQVSAAAVPESGTAAGGETSFPNREPSNPFDKIRAEIDVPESGTGLALQQCSNASEKTQRCIVTSVPDSGTRVAGGARSFSSRPSEEAPRDGVRKFTDEQQFIFDEMERLGMFGKENEARPCWYTFVRDRPRVSAELIGEVKHALKEGRIRTSPGAFAMDKWKRWGKPNR